MPSVHFALRVAGLVSFGRGLLAIGHNAPWLPRRGHWAGTGAEREAYIDDMAQEMSPIESILALVEAIASSLIYAQSIACSYL